MEFLRIQVQLLLRGMISSVGAYCIPEFHLLECKYEKSKKRKLTLTLKLIISIFFALLGVTLVLSLLFGQLEH